MMTADEKNHVVSNANDELDRQLLRLDTIFPYIAGEISEEARMGSLTHWAYSNRNTAKPPANERPRREAAANKELAHALHEAEAASRSEARREAVLARRQRRTHADSDMDDTRGRKGQGSKSRAGDASHGAQAKRRKVERPAPVDTGAAMERTTSGTGASGRGGSKDGAEAKKRARTTNSTSAARKRYVMITDGSRDMLTFIETILALLSPNHPSSPRHLRLGLPFPAPTALGVLDRSHLERSRGPQRMDGDRPHPRLIGPIIV